MNFFFDVIAIRSGGESVCVHCDNVQEFQKEVKVLYSEGYSTMTAYVFNENGFQRKSNYLRGKKEWIKLN